MIINKCRIDVPFDLELKFKTNSIQSHSKATDTESVIHEIINAHMDAMKVKLAEHFDAIPDKLG